MEENLAGVWLLRLQCPARDAGGGEMVELPFLQTESFVEHGMFWLAGDCRDERCKSKMGIICGRRSQGEESGRRQHLSPGGHSSESGVCSGLTSCEVGTETHRTNLGRGGGHGRGVSRG